MLSNQILYVGPNITDMNGDSLLTNNHLYYIEEPWEFSNENIITNTLDNKWIFFIYDDSGKHQPRGYELNIKYIKHPREVIIKNIIDS